MSAHMWSVQDKWKRRKGRKFRKKVEKWVKEREEEKEIEEIFQKTNNWKRNRGIISSRRKERKEERKRD